MRRAPARPLLFATLLIALTSCGGDRPVAPDGDGPPAGIRVRTKLGDGVARGVFGTLTDTLVVAVHDRSRRIAGPLATLPDSAGRFAVTLEAPSGPDRVVAIEALGISHFENDEAVRGTILLGLSDPFTLEPDATDSVSVTFSRFTTDFIQPATVYTGSATFVWGSVPNATLYRVRETLADSSVVDRTTADTMLVVAADAGGVAAPRTFQIRAENRFAAGAWSPPIAAAIIGQTGGPVWTVLDDGTGPGPGGQFAQSGAFHRDTRTFYVYGSIIFDSLATSDGTLWAFSLGAPGWREVASGRPSGPGPRLAPAVAVSPDGNRIFVFAGIASGASAGLDLWQYDPSANRWLRLDDGASAAAVGIPSLAQDQSFLWAGTGGTHLGLFVPGTGQLFRFDIGQRAWSETIAAGGPLEPRLQPAIVYEPTSAGLAVFGGTLESTDSLTAELFAFTEGTSTWTMITAQSGTAMPPRGLPSAAFDPGFGLFVFGGYTDDAATVPWDDVWLFQPESRTVPSGWVRVIPHGGLGARLQSLSGFDPVTRSLVVTGGLTFDHSVWSIAIP